MVGSQQSAQTFDADDVTLTLMLRLNDPVEALVNPLVVAVLKLLGQNTAKLLFGGEDQLAETFSFDVPDESLHVGIEIRTPWR